jgi:tetratricopeptide (TPR) repeat protein
MSALVVFVPYSISSESSAPSKPKGKRTSAADRSPSLYEQGVAAAKKEDFKGALKLFQKAIREKPRDADILNMLAYSQRKLGKIDEALANYDKALKIRPRFAEAREYRGEAYIQAALNEIKILRSYGKSAENELDELIEAFQEAAAKLSIKTESKATTER